MSLDDAMIGAVLGKLLGKLLAWTFKDPKQPFEEVEDFLHALSRRPCSLVLCAYLKRLKRRFPTTSLMCIEKCLPYLQADTSKLIKAYLDFSRRLHASPVDQQNRGHGTANNIILLDGMNILMHKCDTPNWQQLMAAGGHYRNARNASEVYAILKDDVVVPQMVLQELGDDFITRCPSGKGPIDDQFMIDKALREKHCSIITNDLFRDWPIDGFLKGRVLPYKFDGPKFIPLSVQETMRTEERQPRVSELM